MIIGLNGQILAEVLIAVGIIVVVLIGMSSLMSKTTKTVRQDTTRGQAANLVTAQLRYYKGQRDLDPDAFFGSMPPPIGSGGGGMKVFEPCGGANDGWSVEIPSPTPITEITCEVMFDDTNLSGNGITITVRASWTETTLNDNNVSLSTTLMRF